MHDAPLPDWLRWAREIQAMSQTGLTFSQDSYDRARYDRLQAIAAEIAASHTDLAAEYWQAQFSRQPGYATPKVDVRAAIISAGRILLVQERADERWCLPGGWADIGESPAEMVAREVREESGLEVVARRIVGVYDANRVQTPLEFFHAYKIVFLCEVVGGAPRPSDETLAVDYFDPSDPPPLSLNRTGPRHLADALAAQANPAWTAIFD
jgi:ADP-ribose pyrophosphatase YjhB (NUDIX family)